MPDIEIQKTSEEPGAASLAVTVPADTVRAAEDRATRTYQTTARLPGFRKGKVPTPVIRKHFAADIRQAVLEDVVRESWRKAVAQESLKPIAEPHIHNLKWEPGAPVTFEFHVEVRPEIVLARTGGFQLKRTVPVVTADNAGKKMTLFCPLVTATQLALLILMANYNTGPVEVNPEYAATTYNVIFAAENPVVPEQHAGEFPDEDKETVGPPYDRYKATLNLIVV